MLHKARRLVSLGFVELRRVLFRHRSQSGEHTSALLVPFQLPSPRVVCKARAAVETLG